jgi:acid phosphatase
MNSLAQQGALLTNSHGLFRPSQPNYLALFSGSNQGVTDNNGPRDLGNRANLGAQLIAAGRSFVGYAEGLPAVGSKVLTSGKYDRKHNPWSDFSNVPAASNRPFTDFPSDFTKLPTVGFVVPNEDHNSHDGSVAAADAWLKAKLGAYAAWAKGHNSVLVVTWDEGDTGDAGNHIPTIVYGANVKAGKYAQAVDHYGLLRTLEDMYALAAVGGAGAAKPIDYVWNGAAPLTPLPPTNLTAAPISGTAVNLTWKDNATNESGYKVERSTDGKTYYPLSGTGANFTSARNDKLAPGKRYYYRVFAWNGAGISAYSNVVSVVPPVVGVAATPPSPLTWAGDWVITVESKDGVLYL